MKSRRWRAWNDTEYLRLGEWRVRFRHIERNNPFRLDFSSQSIDAAVNEVIAKAILNGYLVPEKSNT